MVLLAAALVFRGWTPTDKSVESKARMNPRTPHGSQTAILTYHDIIESRQQGSVWFDCTVAELNAQLDWLVKRHAHFVSIDQVYSHLVQGAKIPDHAIAITFADNYE